MTSMRFSLDWKFVVMLVATIAGVVVPAWLWRADQAVHSVQVAVVSQTALQPEDVSAVSGLTIAVDGKKLENPYLTVLEIRNDGTRPISASDFEGPMEIKMLEKIAIARAQVTLTIPKDLQPTIESSKDVLKLAPLLLNPNDSMIVSIVTSGGVPKFTARGRIEGVTEVKLINSAMDNKTVRLFGFQAVVAFALLVLYGGMMWAFLTNGTQISRRMMLFSAFSAATGSVFLLIQQLESIDLSGWQSVLIFVLTVLVAMFLGVLINGKSKVAQ